MTDAPVDAPDATGAEARLDAEKLEVLRAWGAGLAADSRDEVRAAGKAIVLLIEEIDHLYVELWHERDGSRAEPEPPVENLERTLRERIRLAVRKPRALGSVGRAESPRDPQPGP